jgi:hypothetical protein
MTDMAANFGTSAKAATRSSTLVEIAVEPGAAQIANSLAGLADPRHAFLRSAWFSAGAGDQLNTIVGRRPDGSPLVAAPVEPRSFLLKSVPGSYWPLRSFPIAADAADAELAAFLADSAARRALGPAWRLGPVRSDDPTASRLMQAAAAGGWTVLSRTLGTAFILDLAALRAAGPWPKTATLRKNRHIERKLAEQGELEFRQATGDGWTAELFDTLATIERNSWIATKTDASDAKFMAPAHRLFWEAAAADPGIAAQMHASLLFVGGAPAAFSFFLRSGSFVSLIANSYDERFRQQSPGRVLLYRDFQQLSETGVDTVDWGAGDPGYKSEMGAVPGPAILDHLFVRSPILARLIRPLWRR